MNKNTTLLLEKLAEMTEQKHFKKSYIIIEKLDAILRSNVATDENLLENNKPLIFIDENEIIKTETLKALLVIHKDDLQVKVYLDDKRITPKGYLRAFWPDDVIRCIKTLNVSEISLDHDLGDDLKGTGYDVVCYIEEQVYFNGYIPPIIKVHSDNSSAKAKMNLGIKNINKIAKERL